MLSPAFGDGIEDKAIVSELRRTLSNNKSNGTPMKMLIAQEMSKDVGSKRKPPNVVAKLMGLDALPRQQHNLAAQRCHSKGSSRHSLSHSRIPVEGWEQDQGFSGKQSQCEGNLWRQLNKYKDVDEIWQQSPRTTCAKDSSPRKGMHNGNLNVNEKKMALVRQKFMEAKHLVTDEKLRQTKEFQDALEVLSSNRELFLKFLEEPNSTFSQHLYHLQSLPLPPEAKHITVLRTSKMVDKEKFTRIGKKGDKQTKKPAQMGQVTGWGRDNTACSPPFPSLKLDGHPSQPTRIVVLKPRPGKTRDIKIVASPSPLSPRMLNGEDFFEEPEDDDARESGEVANEITRQMRENLMGYRSDETLFSSVFSNGYIGDNSSFDISEKEYAVENFSDSEVMSPTSRHSWDYTNKFGSPYSSSSFSRASCSPESSVCREAKKRLLERWAMMSSQEQRHARRNSRTLGEMLALSDTKNLVRSEEEGSNKEPQEPRGSISSIASKLNKDECTCDPPKNILRSKSGAISSTAYGTRLNVEVSDPEPSKEQVSKELTKAKSTKSSLKGKVSSLFFSKNKKINKEKFSGSQSTDTFPSATPGTPGSPIVHPRKISNDASQCVNNGSIQECVSPVRVGSTSKTPLQDLACMGQKQGMISLKGGLSVAKPPMPIHISENQDQPSPISVLEPLFEEDESTIPESSGSIKPVHQGLKGPSKSNLIDKLPSLESIARNLSWDDSCSESTTLYSSKLSSVSPGAKEEEQDWVFSVQSLLSAAGVNSEVQFESFICKWHSPESPLDPSLRDKYANSNDKEPLHEAKRRQWRSNRKLVFDCVNAALLETTGYMSDSCMKAMSFGKAQMRIMDGASSMPVDHVWAQMKEWFSGEEKRSVGDDGDCNSLVEERMVLKEVVGKGWVDHMKLEIENLGKEIEGKLLEQLVNEAVTDLTGKVF